MAAMPMGIGSTLKLLHLFTYDSQKTRAPSHTKKKNPHPSGKKFFFECNLLDWPIRSSR